LELSPDVIFNTILQGVSRHVSNNPEHFRNVFVSHLDCKKKSITRNDSFVKGKWGNPWESMVLDIGRQIRADLSGQHAQRVIKTTFTTTTIAAHTAHVAVFMDVVKSYYEYEFYTSCGIPWIDVNGTKEDWQRIADVIGPLLDALNLSSWNAELQLILSHFVKAFDGVVDFEHWNRIFNYYGPKGSGGTAHVSGWIAKLYLYIKTGLNPLIGSPDASVPFKPRGDPKLAGTPWLDNTLWSGYQEPVVNTPKTSVQLASFPCGMTSTDFLWFYLTERIDMIMLAGVVGNTITETGALKPEVGWIISGQCD
jgi:Domain of unknown function (DUF4419)